MVYLPTDGHKWLTNRQCTAGSRTLDWSQVQRPEPLQYEATYLISNLQIFVCERFGSATKVAHFIGAVKPWTLGYNRATKSVERDGEQPSHVVDFVHTWWQIFMEDIDSSLIWQVTSVSDYSFLALLLHCIHCRMHLLQTVDVQKRLLEKPSHSTRLRFDKIVNHCAWYKLLFL